MYALKELLAAPANAVPKSTQMSVDNGGQVDLPNKSAGSPVKTTSPITRGLVMPTRSLTILDALACWTVSVLISTPKTPRAPKPEAPQSP
jgi:hypothetical protein